MTVFLDTVGLISIWDKSDQWQAYGKGDSEGAGIVDQVSFIILRRMGITKAFTNDRHFRVEGFETLF